MKSILENSLKTCQHKYLLTCPKRYIKAFMIKEITYGTEIGRNEMEMKQMKSSPELPHCWKGLESNLSSSNYFTSVGSEDKFLRLV